MAIEDRRGIAVDGGDSTTSQQIVTTSSDTVQAGVAVVIIDRASPTATAITLPNAALYVGARLRIVDLSTSVTAHTITLTPYSTAQKVMRQSTLLIQSLGTDLGSVDLIAVADPDDATNYIWTTVALSIEAVRVDHEQAFTAAQEIQGRANISVDAHSIFNIVDYQGAQGGTDCSAAAAAAIAAMVAAGSGRLFFPEGKWYFTSAITGTIPAGKSFAISGAGSGVTELYFSGSDGITLSYGSKYSGCHISGLTITTGTSGGHTAIRLTQPASDANPAVTGITNIADVVTRGSDGLVVSQFWDSGIDIHNVSNVNIIELTAFGPTGTGIVMQGLPASSTYGVVYNISKSNFNSLGVGIKYGSYIQGVTVNQSNFTGSVQGILAPTGSTGVLSQLSVLSSQFNVSGAAVWFQEQMGEFTFIGNTVLITPNTWGVLGIAVDFTILGNQFAAGVLGANSIGIDLTGGGLGHISGNTFATLASGIKLALSTTAVNVSVNTFSGVTIEIADLGVGNTIGIDATAGITGTLPVAHGGTGKTSNTSHSVLVGAGTSALTALSVGTNGQLLLGSTGADPAFATMSQDCTITNAGVVTCLKTNNVSFGTAATQNTGTSGATVPFLNGGNSWSGVNHYTNATDSTSGITGGVIIDGGLGVAKNVSALSYYLGTLQLASASGSTFFLLNGANTGFALVLAGGGTEYRGATHVFESLNGGTTFATINSSGFALPTDRGLVLTNQTSAAAANAGSLTNAPAAGNPTFWLKLSVNGTNYSIPLWPG